MAQQYVCKEEDRDYRLVSVRHAASPAFSPVPGPGQIIFYPDADVVLEVRRHDGSSHLEYNGCRTQLSCTALDTTKLCIDQRTPLERLWLRVGDSPVSYKVPVGLPVNSGWILELPAGIHNVQLHGDQYFEKVYQI